MILWAIVKGIAFEKCKIGFRFDETVPLKCLTFIYFLPFINLLLQIYVYCVIILHGSSKFILKLEIKFIYNSTFM